MKNRAPVALAAVLSVGSLRSILYPCSATLDQVYQQNAGIESCVAHTVDGNSSPALPGVLGVAFTVNAVLLRSTVAAHLTRVPFENLPNVYRFQNLGITGIPSIEFFLEGIEQLKPLGFAVCGNRLRGGWRLRIITGIMLIASRHAKAVHPRGHIREGFHHTSIDIP
jgi:hypothetical protein